MLQIATFIPDWEIRHLSKEEYHQRFIDILQKLYKKNFMVSIVSMQEGTRIKFWCDEYTVEPVRIITFEADGLGKEKAMREFVKELEELAESEIHLQESEEVLM